MRCPRCAGLMVRDIFQDILDETGAMSFHGWRCPTCGEIMDPVILSHRRHGSSLSGRPMPKRVPPLRLT